MFNCKKLFKLQIRPPSLILLITTSQDRWIFPSQSWEVKNSIMIIIMTIKLNPSSLIFLFTSTPHPSQSLSVHTLHSQSTFHTQSTLYNNQSTHLPLPLRFLPVGGWFMSTISHPIHVYAYHITFRYMFLYHIPIHVYVYHITTRYMFMPTISHSVTCLCLPYHIPLHVYA